MVRGNKHRHNNIVTSILFGQNITPSADDNIVSAWVSLQNKSRHDISISPNSILQKMNRPKTIGAAIGAITGFWCWFLLGFMGLPQLLIYISGIWVIEPVLRFFGVYGQINLLLPALFMCIVSFTFYGWLLAAITAVFTKGARQE